MTDPDSKARPIAVPASRTRRLAGLGGMASGIAGNMAAEAVRQLATGRVPDRRSLLLTPSNAARITDQLARMRGAAMKVGQLMSMDAGELLPPQLAQIMARLRADADYMPPKQLRSVLNQEWGDGWIRQFHRFDVRPVAAASIGQVHRAQTKDGRDLAIKVQYPGVAQSIDSDVQNVGALIRMSGLLPAGLDLSALLEEAKAQLHDEADYARERDQLRAFSGLMNGMAGFALPEPQEDLTTARVLSMTYLHGHPIEALESASQSLRNDVMTRLIGLLFAEIFNFGLIQSDPNFANFRYDPEEDRIILLDFGATRSVSRDLAANYAALFRNALAGAGLRSAAHALGFFDDRTAEKHQRMVLDMLELVFSPLRDTGWFDFGDKALADRLNRAGMAMAEDGEFAHVPPIDTLFLQRKFGGLYLLGTRLRARVDLKSLLAPYL